MRKLLVAALALGVMACSGAAWAIVSTEKDVPVTDQNGAVKSGTLTLQTTDGKTIAKADIKDGKAHVKVDEKDITPKTKVVVKIHTDADPKTGAPAKDKEKDEPVGLFLDKGLNVDTLGPAVAATAASNLHQIGLAVHHHPAVTEHPATAPAPMTAPLRMVDTSFFQFGFSVGENWTKTSANDFGPGLGGSTIFDHTFSNPIFGINAGYYVPIIPGVSAGFVAGLVSGDMGGSNGVSLTTPSGIVGTSLVRRDYGIDTMGRIYINSVWTPFGFNMFVEGGAEFANYRGSMVNSGVETFQSTQHTTSGIAGGGFQLPICGPLGIASDGVCPLQLVAEYDHVFVNTSFFTGMTALSSATAQVKGEDRVMGGFNFVVPTGNRPNAGRLFANWGF
jgi:hypothetical protein